MQAVLRRHPRDALEVGWGVRRRRQVARERGLAHLGEELARLGIERGLVDLDPPAVREIYLRNLKSFLNKVERDCTNVGADYMLISTDQDLGDALSYYLNRRAARAKR